LTTAELRHLTDIDHRDHDALLAFDPGTGAAVAVARYIRPATQRQPSWPYSSATTGKRAVWARP